MNDIPAIIWVGLWIATSAMMYRQGYRAGAAAAFRWLRHPRSGEREPEETS